MQDNICLLVFIVIAIRKLPVKYVEIGLRNDCAKKQLVTMANNKYISLKPIKPHERSQCLKVLGRPPLALPLELSLSPPRCAVRQS